ncbi:uncharacterized protein RCC_01956 [Ramularia collo-cygni]|uniref:Uncharacterized protein n=1 Tax=Ramularia collo-cygni TaxID=112498 RepID=A0A2D3URG8_9PEZI|nr:uncharacterized protein RCC_01956 [Ramularia collo-cygni]CZT16115.1 uncharacterized protein RCC_01956 [Ramularia collo-cygni]
MAAAITVRASSTQNGVSGRHVAAAATISIVEQLKPPRSTSFMQHAFKQQPQPPSMNQPCKASLLLSSSRSHYQVPALGSQHA